MRIDNLENQQESATLLEDELETKKQELETRLQKISKKLQKLSKKEMTGIVGGGWGKFPGGSSFADSWVGGRFKDSY